MNTNTYNQANRLAFAFRWHLELMMQNVCMARPRHSYR